MTDREISTLIVDDQTAFLDVAAQVVALTPGFRSVGELSQPESALPIVASEEPDLVIVDLHMPRMNGIELIRRIKAASPQAFVVLISAEDPKTMPAAAHCCGASAVIRKQDFGVAYLKRLGRELGKHANGV